ncbi:MAG: TolC family protein [Spirochaetales bacterium]|nr:TolC family protein [Spirochaetales bacterium]
MMRSGFRYRFLGLLGCGCLLWLAAPGADAQVIRLGIEEALARALRSSDSIEYARLDYVFQSARHAVSIRDFFPYLTIGYTHNDTVVYYDPDSRLREMSIGIEQLLYSGGTRIHERRISADRLRIRSSAIGELEKELRLEVVNRFVEILKLGLQIAILERGLAGGREQVVIAEEELSLGEITRLDCMDIKLAVQELEIDLGLLRQEEDLLEFELKQLLDIPPAGSVELTGAINPDFRGMLTIDDPAYYLDRARRSSLELKQRAVEITALQAAVQQARWGWLPSVSTQLELSVAGRQFPLTDPGFSVGVNLDFSTPFIPFRTGFTAGGRTRDQRSLAAAVSADPVENLDDRLNLRAAKVELQKAESEMERAQQALEYSIFRQLEKRSSLLENLHLEEHRIELQEQRLSIEELMLEIGELTRLEYLESGIELARQRVDQLSRIADLFRLETALLAQCGSELLESSHRCILTADAEQ